MYQDLDGPAKQYSKSVTSTVVVEVINVSALYERKVVTLQPIDGKIWVYFGDGDTTPSAATVKADGFIHFKNTRDSYEASTTQPLFIVADTGTVDVRIAERA